MANPTSTAVPDSNDPAMPPNEALALFQQALDVAATGLTFCSRDLCYVMANQTYAELAGLPIGEIVGRPIVEVMGEKGFDVIRPYVERVLAGARVEYETELPWAARGMRWIRVAYTPKLRDDGVVSGWFATVTDMTERKRAEAALARTAAELQALVSTTAEMVWKAGLEGTPAEDSPSWRSFTGQTCEEWFGHGWLNAVHPEDRARTRRTWSAALSKGTIYENQYRIRHVSGEWRWTSARATPIFDEHGRLTGYIGMNSDITERVQAEQALRRSEAQFRAAAEALPGMLFVSDSNGRNTYVNSGYCTYVGCTAEELFDLEYTKIYHPDDAERVWRAWYETVKNGEPFSAEYRFRRHDGEYRWHLVRARPVRSANGEIEYWVGTATDIHDRRVWEDRLSQLNSELETRVREAVRERSEAQGRLAHSQKLEALGQLAGGIAHDFNNVLQAIQGAAELIERRADNSDQVRHLAQAASQASKRGSAVTQRLLAFARRADLKAEPIEAAELLSEMREILSHTLGTTIEVQVRAAPELPPFVADRNQLETVLVNLATNARDAMSSSGRLSLSADLDVVPNRLGSEGPLKPGAYVRLFICDTGPGMAPELLAHACEPFFTTKAPGSGSGLGLAMARGFAEQSGGALLIESPPENGLTVNLWFPVAENIATKPESRKYAPDSDAPGGRVRVMFVDDEDLIRSVVGEGLAEAGFDVLSVGSGSEALALLNRSEAPDVLVCDLSMPSMDGLAVIREARRLRPQLAAILLTGYTTELASNEEFSMMRKPVTIQALAERIGVSIAQRGPLASRCLAGS